jgi:hypothetical protein
VNPYTPSKLRDLWYFSRLTTLREDAKLTQQALAELTREFDPAKRGVSKETISKMERRHGATRTKALIVFEAIQSKSKKVKDVDTELTMHPKGGVSGLVVNE